MFRAILYAQWKWSRISLLLAVIVAFGLPLASVHYLPATGTTGYTTSLFLEHLTRLGPAYPLLATILALMLAVSAWAADHAGRHVYALSLPVPRWKLVGYRLGAGLLLLAVPIFALWFGDLVAVSVTELPSGLRAYPNLLALRFALAATVAFGVFFAISAGTTRTAGVVLGVLAGLVVAQLLLTAAGSPASVLGWVFNNLFTWPGPFDIFSGRWVLIDV